MKAQAVITEVSNQEVWKPVFGYEDSYEVSSHGRVRSVDRVAVGANGVRRKFKGRIIKPRDNGTGYMYVELWKGGEGKKRYTHRLVLTAFTGPCPDGFEACHYDGNPGNNRLDNLRWDTKSANQLDRVRHGTHHEARKSNCKNGHPFYSEILAPSYLKQGWRHCIVCQRANGYIRRHDIPEADHWKVRDRYLEEFLLSLESAEKV